MSCQLGPTLARKARKSTIFSHVLKGFEARVGSIRKPSGAACDAVGVHADAESAVANLFGAALAVDAVDAVTLLMACVTEEANA